MLEDGGIKVFRGRIAPENSNVFTSILVFYAVSV